MRVPEVGEVFHDRFTLVEVLGEGSFARVFRAHDRAVDAVVALKILTPRFGVYEAKIESRFRREAKLASQLTSPHTVRVREWGKSDDGLLYMAAELVDGEPLSRLLRRKGCLSPRLAVHIAQQVLIALSEAHAAGVLHRDVKPSNIMVSARGTQLHHVTLVDFGLAKPSEADATKITRTGKSAGTPLYMSPEQVYSAPLSPASDIFSLGSVMFDMLTGEHAFDADSMKAIMKSVVSETPVNVAQSRIPPPLRPVLARMLDKDAETRFQSAEEVASELAAIESELDDPDATEPYDAPSNRHAVRTGERDDSRQWILAVFATVVVLLIAIFVLTAIG